MKIEELLEQEDVKVSINGKNQMLDAIEILSMLEKI